MAVRNVPESIVIMCKACAVHWLSRSGDAAPPTSIVDNASIGKADDSVDDDGVDDDDDHVESSTGQPLPSVATSYNDDLFASIEKSTDDEHAATRLQTLRADPSF
jgi:hypothetical protein